MPDPDIDVFLSYAGRDRQHVARLHDRLAPIYGRERLFLDQASTATRPFTATIPEALKGSRAVVFLVTDAWSAEEGYPKDEVSIAVDHARRNGGRPAALVVNLDGVARGSSELLFGLNALPPITPERAWDTDAIAAAVVERVAPRPRPARSFAESETLGDLVDLAHDFDRSAPWMRIEDLCRRPRLSDRPFEHVYLLAFGDHVQNLHLLLERVQRRIADRVTPHHVVELRYLVDRTYAGSAALWMIRLRDGLLGLLQRGEGEVAELVAAATRQRPLFLLLHLEAEEPFDQRQQEALTGFLETRLPAVLPPPGDGHPVRLLVAVDEAEQRPERLRASLRASRRPGLYTEALPRVKFPDADEVMAWIGRQSIDGAPIDEEHPRVKKLLAKLRLLEQDGGLTFEGLVGLLGRTLAELKRDPPSFV